MKGWDIYTPGNKYGNPKKGPIKATVLLKGDYMGFHVSLGECNIFPNGFNKGSFLLIFFKGV